MRAAVQDVKTQAVSKASRQRSDVVAVVSGRRGIARRSVREQRESWVEVRLRERGE